MMMMLLTMMMMMMLNNDEPLMLVLSYLDIDCGRNNFSKTEIKKNELFFIAFLTPM